MSPTSRTVALLAMSTLSLLGCATEVAPEASGATASAVGGPLGNKCSCDDLECWRKESDEKSVKQLECAKSALDAAATLGTGGSKTVLEIATGITEASVALAKDEGQLLTFLKNVTLGGGLVAKQLAGETALGECLDNGKSVVSDILGTIEAISELKKKETSDAQSLNTIIGLLGNTTDAAFKFTGAMNECMSLVQKTDNEVIKAFRDFLKSWDKVLGTLKAALAIVECGPTIVQGGQVLIGNIICLGDDIRRLEDQKQSIHTAAAYVGSRMFNHAKYTGCTEAVKDRWFASADDRLNECRGRCESLVDGYVPENNPNQRGSWVASCQLMCAGTFGNNGNVDLSYCDEVKKVFHVSRTFRHLYLEDGTAVGDARRRGAKSRREDILVSLAAIEKHWSYVSPDDDFASFEDLKNVIQRPDTPLALAAAAHFFTVSFESGDSTYFFRLLETAGTEGANHDRVFSKEELGWFRDEVNDYRDDSEYGE